MQSSFYSYSKHLRILALARFGCFPHGRDQITPLEVTTAARPKLARLSPRYSVSARLLWCFEYHERNRLHNQGYIEQMNIPKNIGLSAAINAFITHD